jgi:hypothetical protein
MSVPIKILSWNTCWGCQKADETSKNDGTSVVLATKCAELKNNMKNPHDTPPCEYNVEKLILEPIQYDIIFLQEYVKTSLEDKLVSKGYDLCQGNVAGEGIATFFKTDRFKKLNTTDIIDNIQTDGKGGRGFQIIFVQDKKTQAYYILMNIHNGKRIKESYKEGLETRISTILNNKIEVLERVVKDNPNIINGINIIFGGDFNDGGDNEPKDMKPEDVDKYRNYWKGLMPFSYLDPIVTSLENVKNVIKKLNTMKVKIQGKDSSYAPPKTCCTGRVFVRSEPVETDDAKEAQGNDKDREGDKLYGDYILINNALEYKEEIQTLPEQQNPSADHLAVTCTISLTQIKGGSIINYLDKYLKYKNKYLNLKK